MVLRIACRPDDRRAPQSYPHDASRHHQRGQLVRSAPHLPAVLAWMGLAVLGLSCGPETPTEPVPTSPYRLVQPRLSAAVPYAPCLDHSPERGYCRALGGRPQDRLVPEPRSGTRGRGDEESPRTADALRGSAAESLLRSEERSDLARAFSDLEEALALDDADPAVLTDLAAVYHVHAGSADFPWHRVRALELVVRAHRLAPRRAFIAFDRALFLEALGLNRSAVAAWREYLELDSASPWADEARSHLANLERPSRQELWLARRATLERALAELDRGTMRGVVLDFPIEVHDLLRDELLPRWAELAADDPASAEKLAIALRALASLVAETTDDPILAAASRRLEPEHAEAIEALDLFGRGRALYEREPDYSAAEILLDEAAEHFEAVANPLAAWARFFAIVSRFQGGDPSLDGLEALADVARSSPLLAARVEQLAGIAAGRRQDHPAAIVHYERVSALLERFGEDTPEVAFARFLRGEALANLGHRDRAWQDIYPALRALIAAGEPRRLHAALAVTADGLVDLGLAEAALPFYDELVAHAAAWGDPYALTTACQGRAGARSRWIRDRLTETPTEPTAENHTQAVLDDLGCAMDAVETIGDPKFRRAVRTDLAVVRAEVGADPPPSRLRQLAEARRFYDESEEWSRLARLFFLESLTLAEIGETDRSEAALAEALDLYDQLLMAPEAANEPRFLPEAEQAFRRMIAHQLDGGSPRAALAVAERSRRLPGGTASAASAEDRPMLDVLPADLEVLVFQDLDDRVVVFRALDGSLEVAEIAATPGDIQNRVERLHLELLDGAADTPLAELYTLLLGEPLDGPLSERVVIVPDRSVAALPFAALRDPETDTYLVERATLAVVPSLSILRRSSRRLAGVAEASHTLLALGDPEGESPVVRRLPPLPSARREVEQITALYEQSTLHLGRQASRDRWIAEAPRHAVLHYAGHSSIDPFHPHRSVLHLAPPLDAPSGDLSSGEIRRLAFPDTRLVVLSSCSSSLDHSTRRRVPGGLADAFLAAGVPSVIGALWPIDDRATAQLMVRLHRHLAAGVAPAEALRQMQLEALAEGDELADPWAWGAFRLFGGMPPSQESDQDEAS